MPLGYKALQMLGIGSGERLHHAGKRGVVAIAKRDGDGELAILRDVDLAHHRDVAIERLTEAPGHVHMRAEVLIAVAGADVAGARTREAAVGAEGQRDVVLPG